MTVHKVLINDVYEIQLCFKCRKYFFITKIYQFLGVFFPTKLIFSVNVISVLIFGGF